MIISAVPTDLLDTAWPRLVGLLSMAFDMYPGRFDADDILNLCRSEEMAVWAVIDETEIIGAFTTRIAEYPRTRALVIDWVGGNHMQNWLDDVLSLLNDYAADCECGLIEGHGRSGWGRILKRHGFREECVSIRKDVNHG